MTTNNIVIIINNKSFTPVITYNNTDIEKSKIFSDNKGKAGIYLWTHKESNKTYVGSAVDLSKRLTTYYSPKGLKRTDSYIARALLVHTYSAFSLSILEFIDITNLSKEEARKLILEREQFYIDSLEPTYNINPIAGSRLGTRHTNETKALMSAAKTGENHPMYNKTHTEETKALISRMLSGENHPKFGISLSDDIITKISVAKGGGSIFVYNSDSSLVNSFPSARKALYGN
jgi:group I intron endonuclease